MNSGNWTLAALAAAVAVFAAGCGSDEGCPEAAALTDDNFTPPQSCTIPTATLTLAVRLCEECSHTSPSCTADVLSVPANQVPGEIFLSTQWEVCEENKSCSAQACGTPTCTVTVATPGDYDVFYIVGTNPDGTFQTQSFPVTFGPQSGVSACST